VSFLPVTVRVVPLTAETVPLTPGFPLPCIPVPCIPPPNPPPKLPVGIVPLMMLLAVTEVPLTVPPTIMVFPTERLETLTVEIWETVAALASMVYVVPFLPVRVMVLPLMEAIVPATPLFLGAWDAVEAVPVVAVDTVCAEAMPTMPAITPPKRAIVAREAISFLFFILLFMLVDNID